MAAEQITSFVGQLKAKAMLSTWKERDDFPHFLIIAGESGSGRQTLAKEFARTLDARIHIQEDISAEAIRNLIAAAYDVPDKLVCVIPNADNMSIAAKNSLLKLTEEPPANGYIVMTLLSLNNTLDTLLSRSQQIVMEPYTIDDLMLLCDNPELCKLATTPGMLQVFQEKGTEYVKSLADFCDKLIYHIDTVSAVNAMKSGARLKFKDSESSDKFDLNMFFAGINYVLNIATQEMLSGDKPADWRRLSAWYNVISEYSYMFNRPGLNKQAVYDQLVFSIRNKLRREQ